MTGIFKNFFHKKEDFNNKGLISKKENFGVKSPDRAYKTGIFVFAVFGVILLISLYFAGFLSKCTNNSDWFCAMKILLYFISHIIVFALSFFVYYYYLGGEKEISDMLEEYKFPFMVLVWLVFIVGMTMIFRNIVPDNQAPNVESKEGEEK